MKQFEKFLLKYALLPKREMNTHKHLASKVLSRKNCTANKEDIYFLVSKIK